MVYRKAKLNNLSNIKVKNLVLKSSHKNHKKNTQKLWKSSIRLQYNKETKLNEWKLVPATKVDGRTTVINKSSKIGLFLALAQPNIAGVSRWVKATEWVDDYATLKLGNGLTWGRKNSKLDRLFVIERDYSLTKSNALDAIRLNGLKF